LISLGPQLVSLLIFLVLPILVLIRERCVDSLAEADALEECVLGLQVHWALLVQDLLELIPLVPRLLATPVALYSHDFMVCNALSGGFRVVPLASVGAVAVAALVVAALGEALVFLVLLVGPSLHHVVELHDSLRAIAAEVVVDVLQAEAVLKAVDDVLVGDVGDGGVHLEEAPGVGPENLVILLLDLLQVMMSTCMEHGALEVVDEGLLLVLPGVDGVWLEAFEPGEQCGLQPIGK
jgi:hypothetical protein